MKKAADLPTTQAASGQASPFKLKSAFFLIADTSARLFFPSIGGTLLGVWADHSFKTTPWLMIAGIVTGVALAIFLVRAQLQAVKQQKDTRTIG